MYTVIETPTFAADAETLWSEEERMAFTVWIAAHPLAGVVAPKSGGWPQGAVESGEYGQAGRRAGDLLQSAGMR